MDYQKALRKKFPKQFEKEKLRSLMILDDVIGKDSNIKYDDTVQELFTNGRHMKITLFITIQYINGLPPILRQNTDYVIVLKQTGKKYMRKLWEEFFDFLEFDLFVRMIQFYTQDNHVLIFDNKKNSADPLECVFWYKANFEFFDKKRKSGAMYRIGRRNKLYWAQEDDESE